MKVSNILFRVTPFFSVILLIMGGSTFQLGEYPLLPSLYLTAIYYWIIFNPQNLPSWSLFIIGLFYDSLLGYDLGLSSILLMLSWIIGQSIRPLLISYNFIFVWGAFCLYSLGYICLYALERKGGYPLLISWVYGVLLYPLIAWILGHFCMRLHSYV